MISSDMGRARTPGTASRRAGHQVVRGLSHGEIARRVLLVAYYFPPMANTGVLRMLKTARYLPDHGWEPTVVTVDKPDYPTQDPELLAQVPPACPVIRTRCLDPDRLYRLVKGNRSSGFYDLETRGSRGPVSRLMRLVRSAFFVPDTRIGWLPFAVRAGVRAVRTRGIDAVMASGPPPTALLAGAIVARRTRRPFLADFRDPWTEAYFYPDRPAPARALNRKLEAWVLRQASCITAVGEGVADGLRRRLPARERGKVHVIPNGFDPHDFPSDAEPPAPGEPFQLVYCGSLHARRDPRPLLRALEALVESGALSADEVRFTVLGRMTGEVRAGLEASPLRACIRTEGHRPYRESLAAMRRASALVLLVEDGPEGRAILTNKIFEYLGSGRPILALAPEGEASAVIRAAGAGLVVPPRDVVAIAKAVQVLAHGVRTGTFPPADAAVVAGGTRQRQAGCFASFLDAALAASAHARTLGSRRSVRVIRSGHARRVAEVPPAWSRPAEETPGAPEEAHDVLVRGVPETADPVRAEG